VPVINPAASSTGKAFLRSVQFAFKEYLPEELEDYTEFCGQELFGVTGPLDDETVTRFYTLNKPEIEIELFNYAVKEGYLTTSEMVVAEISRSGFGITTVEDMRNTLAFVFDGVMVP
jgi:hypothetical protein